MGGGQSSPSRSQQAEDANTAQVLGVPGTRGLPVRGHLEPHQGVWCGGCGASPIRGTRYKCSVSIARGALLVPNLLLRGLAGDVFVDVMDIASTQYGSYTGQCRVCVVC